MPLLPGCNPNAKLGIRAKGSCFASEHLPSYSRFCDYLRVKAQAAIRESHTHANPLHRVSSALPYLLVRKMVKTTTVASTTLPLRRQHAVYRHNEPRPGKSAIKSRDSFPRKPSSIAPGVGAWLHTKSIQESLRAWPREAWPLAASILVDTLQDFK